MLTSTDSNVSKVYMGEKREGHGVAKFVSRFYMQDKMRLIWGNN